MVIKPPIKLINIKSPSIFLAGSIEMGTAENWQAKIEQSLPDTLTILNPRRDNWDSSWTQIKSNPQFREQVEWELEGLERSDLVAMYFDPNTKSPISMLELGMFSGKAVVCCPEGFWRKGNVDIFCERYDIPQDDTLEDLIQTIYRYFGIK
jgi:hypothetical protein